MRLATSLTEALDCLLNTPALQELDLKVRQFNMLLKGPPALSEAQNINMLWAHLMVDELCRLGSSTFCIAPGEQRHLFALLTPGR